MFADSAQIRTCNCTHVQLNTLEVNMQYGLPSVRFLTVLSGLLILKYL
jgi:hypothetical protein